MRRDFTFDIYRALCLAILENSLIPTRVDDYILSKSKTKRRVILRHDVDRKPNNALKMAEIEYELGIKSTYYFRTTKEVYHKEIIKKINNLGHEIGYHYEVLVKSRGNKEKAIELFEKELQGLRTFVPVKTISMHGSPMFQWTDSDLWNEYDYKDYDIIGEVYLTLNYNHIYYYSDTGRRWDAQFGNVRDKVKTNLEHKRARSTYELIEIIPSLTKDILLNSHPQRWTDNPILWIKELVWQNTKNIIKKHFFISK